MFDLVNWLALLCCFCCDHKSADEEEYDIAERDRARKQITSDMREAGTTTKGPPKTPRLAHAPLAIPSPK